MFSDIVQRFDVPLNALYRERDARKAKGLKTLDLVSGNMNQAGFIFPPRLLKAALMAGAERSRTYSPDPLGQPAARRAVEAYYRGEGLEIPAGQIMITPGTSLSYLYLFKLLANPGDEILCPRPSYPLLDSIAGLCGIQLTGYRLRENSRWEIDFDHLREQITPNTRAIVLISPHNPTGAVATPDEVRDLGAIAAERGLPVISDEVFSPFRFQSGALPRPAALDLPLVFTLNGVSKMLALPGLKIGWIGVTGSATHVKKAIHALDIISDMFLPVNEAAQFALPALLTQGKPFMAQCRKDIQKRMETAAQLLQGWRFVKPEGGFYLTLKVKGDEEKIALDLLKKEGILVHPGYFYDLEESHIVISCVARSKPLQAGLKIINSIRN